MVRILISKSYAYAVTCHDIFFNLFELSQDRPVICLIRDSENANERIITINYHKKFIHVKVRRALLQEIMFTNGFEKALPEF